MQDTVKRGRSGFGSSLCWMFPQSTLLHIYVRFSAMDFLHFKLAKLQNHLAFVQVDPINWKGCVQGFSWSVTLFEIYLLLCQYPLYNKTGPPAVLAPHLNDDEFQKSQAYGKDKAKISNILGIVWAASWFCYDSLWVLFLGLGYSWSFPSAIRLWSPVWGELRYNYTLSLRRVCVTLTNVLHR